MFRHFLTNSMEQIPSFEADRSSVTQENSSHFMATEGSLPHTQQPVTCPYPEPDQSSPCFLIPVLEDPIYSPCRISSPLSTARIVKGKAVPLQAWNGPEGSTKLRFPDFLTTAQNGGKFVSLTHLPPLPPGNTPGTHFC
jgi:hypothetical protein